MSGPSRADVPGMPTQGTAVAVGEHVAEIGRSPGEVLAALATPGAHFEGRDAFVLPGPGAERWCVTSRRPGGLVGLVGEVTRGPGPTVALRVPGASTTTHWDWIVLDAGTGSRSVVRARMSAEVPVAELDRSNGFFPTGARRAVQWLDHRLTGAPFDPHRAEPVGAPRLDPTALVDVRVVVPLPPDTVWRGVLDASTYTVDAAPGEHAHVLPGSPVGVPGERRVLVCVVGGPPVVRFSEVVELGPGRRLVLRHENACRPVESVTTVEPHTEGSEVRVVREVVVSGPCSRLLEDSRAAHLAHLERLAAELVRRAGSADA